MAEKRKKKFIERLRNKYRLVVMNDETFEEKVWLRLSPMNLFIVAGTILLTLATLIIYIIAFTPLREYIPGYADLSMQRKVNSLNIMADSLQAELDHRDQFMQNIRNILTGNMEEAGDSGERPRNIVKPDLHNVEPSREDSELRAMIEAEDRYELMQKNFQGSGSGSVSSFLFFTPLKGTISNRFDAKEKHFGVDVLAAPNEAVKATLDGTVVLSAWTSETGYVIGIQHAGNFISFYKHNSALLKKDGEYVKAGDAVAIVGNSGERSSGPHLHFELWSNGSPVDPATYISF